MNNPQSIPRPLPDHFTRQRADWRRAYKVWIGIHWSLSALATVSAALAAALTHYAAVFGLIAASASALIGIGNPQRQALAYSRASRRLNKACIAFEHDDGTPVDTLLKAQDDGEQIIEAAENEQ